MTDPRTDILANGVLFRWLPNTFRWRAALYYKDYPTLLIEVSMGPDLSEPFSSHKTFRGRLDPIAYFRNADSGHLDWIGWDFEQDIVTFDFEHELDYATVVAYFGNLVKEIHKIYGDVYEDR